MLNYTDELLSSKELHIKIAARLHALRTSARLSLQALADLTGYTKPTVQSWEKGWRDQSGENRIPTLEQLLDLSSVYNCTPEYLLCEYDLPTKQVTDTCRETGLLPENAVQLRNMMASFSSPNLGGANDLFLAFLNHYLSNITLINELIFNRQTLEFSRIAFEEDPYHDILLEGYNAVVNQIEFDIFKDGAFPPSLEAAGKFTIPLTKYYESQNYDKEEIVTIMSHFTDHCMIIAMGANKIKQSDFALSDSFTDIVKSFFEDFPDNVYGFENSYNNYLDYLKVKGSHKTEEAEIV